jgi:carnitine 3-dehydrogenase
MGDTEMSAGKSIGGVIDKATVIGGGVIGGGWVARFLLSGCDVCVYDPDPEAPRKIGEVVANARRSLPALYEHSLPQEGSLTFAASVAEAVEGSGWVSECVPERIDIKLSVMADIQSHCSESAIIASSTSGFKPSELQEGSIRPEQILVAHPFNPVYLVPLVEVVGVTATVNRAKPILSSLGMFPLHVRKEIDAHIADRLLEAVWREGLWLINDDIATTEEIDDAIRYGFGLRWAQMGLFETYRVAGGEAGMAHFIAQFGPCLEWPWTKLMDVPELTDELVNKIASQSDEQSGMHSIRELERLRDDNLVSIMRGLKTQNWGAGELLNQFDKNLRAPILSKSSDKGDKAAMITVERVIPADWTDYNQHMNEGRYGQVFSDAADNVMIRVGANEDYIASGLSYFTVDTHIRYIDESKAGDQVYVTSRISLADGKKLKLAHQMCHSDGRVLAEADQLLVHVDLAARKSSMPGEEMMQRIAELTKQYG